ncbi:MAG: hypothetical protein IJZ46_00480 [Bacilli bacterium]|nr:hypothetical protein [Bacilli bacterium]
MKEKINNLKEKTCNIFKNIKTKITDKENTGMVILGILISIFLVFTAIYVIGTKNISEIEEKTVRNKSEELITYIEDITLSDSKEVDKYIIYALSNSYNKESKSSLTCKEIYEFIKENFTIEITEEKIKNMGISPSMLEKNISYNPTTDSYEILSTKLDGQTIAETPITYYKLEKISKKNKKKYVLTYSKYTIEDPYKMLNYYMDENMKNEGVEDENGNITYNLVDTTPLVNYLTGNGKLGDAKSIIDDNKIDNYATLDKKGTIKITYIAKGDKLLIDKIK